MTYSKIWPLGERRGPGSYDAIFDKERFHASIDKALEANDMVVANFVQDESKVVYMEMYHTKKPEQKRYHRLVYQGPFLDKMIDLRDERVIMDIAQDFLIEHHPDAY